MKQLIIHPQAAVEAADAAAYYQRRDATLGLSFLAETSAAIEKARLQPLFYHILEGDIRRVLVARFPYGVVFRLPDPETVHVIAVMHLHREPGYWAQRLQ